MIHVLVVADQALTREGLAVILDMQPDIRVAGQAAVGREAISQTRQLRPDVILMDIKMPRMNGIEATRQIKQMFPATRILILTTYDEDDLVFDGIRAGASGYLLKDITREQLVEAVRGAVRGESIIDPGVAAKVLAEFQQMAVLAIKRGLVHLP